MVKTNNWRQLNISGDTNAGSKLNMDINIGGPTKPPGKITTLPEATPPSPSAPPVDSVSSKANENSASTSNSPASNSKSDSQSSGNLNGLKQQALTKLGPLVSNLEQPPLEHFRTLMMLIQATDDSSLISRALETANSIPDDKDRAQALLDVVNEINYFTSQDNKDKSAPN